MTVHEYIFVCKLTKELQDVFGVPVKQQVPRKGYLMQTSSDQSYHRCVTVGLVMSLFGSNLAIEIVGGIIIQYTTFCRHYI